MNITPQHIYDFISALPYGNVPQYAKLLSTTPNRLNDFLQNHPLGRKLVRANLVCAAIMGRMPEWAHSRTVRGVLTAANVPKSHPVLDRVFETLPPAYRPDAAHMFRTIINMSSGNVTFSDAVSEITAPFVNVSILNDQQQQRIASHDLEISRLQQIVDLQTQIRSLTYSGDDGMVQQRIPAPNNQTADA